MHFSTNMPNLALGPSLAPFLCIEPWHGTGRPPKMAADDLEGAYTECLLPAKRRVFLQRRNPRIGKLFSRFGSRVLGR